LTSTSFAPGGLTDTISMVGNWPSAANTKAGYKFT